MLYDRLVTGAATQDDLVRNLMDFADEWNDKLIAETAELDLDALLGR